MTHTNTYSSTVRRPSLHVHTYKHLCVLISNRAAQIHAHKYKRSNSHTCMSLSMSCLRLPIGLCLAADNVALVFIIAPGKRCIN